MRTLIFDFGNVLGFFDHNRTLAKVQAHTHLGREEMYQAVYTGDLEERFERGIISEPDFLCQVLKLWNLRCTEDILAEAIADIFHPNPEICALIPRLAGRYRLVLGSNTNILHARRFRAQFAPILEHFQHLVLSHEIGARKPQQPFFQECLRHAQAKPAECLFIDDLTANIAGARQAGMEGLVYQPRNGFFEKLGALGVAVT